MQKSKIVETKKHSSVGASSADRWLNCPASVGMIEEATRRFGEEPQSDAAYEGNKAHALLEYCLKNRLSANKPQKVKTEKETYEDFDPEMRASVQMAIDEVNKIVKPDYELIIEEELSLEHIDKEMFGTPDIQIIEPFGKLYVPDFKYGRKVVDPNSNPQLMFYTLAAAHKRKYDFDEAVASVIQPRAFHKEGPIRRARVSMEELKGKWTTLFKKGIERVRGPNPKTFQGDHCFFCYGKSICPEFNAKVLAKARSDFSESKKLPALKPPKDLTPDEMALVLGKADLLDSWVEGVRKQAFKTLKAGKKIPGYTIGPTLARRYWAKPLATEAMAKKKFGYDAFELKSPAQLEDVAGKDWVKERTVSLSKGEKLVQITNDFKTVKGESNGKKSKK